MQAATTGKHIVCIDDDDAILRAIERTLLAAGFRVTTTTRPKEAFSLLASTHVDAFVCDLYMPEMGGDLLLAMAAQIAPRTARVLITNDTDFTRLTALTVPYSVHAFVAKRDIGSRLVPFLMELLAHDVEVEEAAIEREARGLAHTIVSTLARRDYETVDHCKRLAAWSRRIAAELGLSSSRQLDIELGALLHDIGQMGIDDAVLFKPDRLTEEEWKEVRSHPDRGAKLLAEVPPLRRAIPVVQCHHERCDGAGYPRQLARTAIPIDARIFQIADAYESIVRGGSYRTSRTDQHAREEIAANVGAQFDRDVHQAFFNIKPEEWLAIGKAQTA